MGSQSSGGSSSGPRVSRNPYPVRGQSRHPTKHINTVESLNSSFNGTTNDIHKFLNSFEPGGRPLQNVNPYYSNSPPRHSSHQHHQHQHQTRKASPKQKSEKDRYSENITTNEDFLVKIDMNSLKAMKTVTDLSRMKVASNKKKASRWKKMKKLCGDEVVCMRLTLTTCNVFLLLLGLVGLVTAGIVDPNPLHRVNTAGGSLSCLSVYAIVAALLCLYGVRYKNPSLLYAYGFLIVFTLFIRSISFFVAIFFFEAGWKAVFLLLTAVFEVLLAILGFALALHYKNTQKDKNSRTKHEVNANN